MPDKNLILQTNKAAISIKQLLDKLEADGHLKSNNLSVAEFVFNDLMAFLMLPVFCELEKIGKEKAKEYLEALNACFAVAVKEDAFNEYTIQYINLVGKDNYKDIIPEGYVMISNFDEKALSNNGAFYETMKVNNPGKIGDYYIMLIEAAREIAEDILDRNKNVTVDFIDASLRAMRE